MLMLLLLPHPLLQYPAPASVSIPLGLSYPALRENTHQRFILTRSPLRRRPVLSLEASAANGSVDEEQVSSRRQEPCSSWLRLVVTCVWLHPFSFTRTGFPPCFIIIPIISRRERKCLGLERHPLSHLHSWLAIPPVRWNMNQDVPGLKTYIATKTLPFMTRCRSVFVSSLWIQMRADVDVGREVLTKETQYSTFRLDGSIWVHLWC